MRPIYPYGQGNLNTPHLHDIGGRPVYGDVFFVDSNNNNAGTSASEGSKRKPFSTIDAAINQCTGDETIYVAPGHAETLSTADQIDADVAGISIIGCGNGTRKPTLTYTADAGEFAVGADNVHIEGIRFIASVTGVLKAIDIEAGVDYCTIKNCEFLVEADTTDEFMVSITLNDNNTGCVIDGCLIDMGLGGATNGIHMDADTSRLQIIGNRIMGDYSTANIFADTTASTEIYIAFNVLQNGDSVGLNAQPTIELITGCTGIIRDNFLVDGGANDAASVVADNAILFNNQWSQTDASGTGLATTGSTTLTA